MRRRGVLLLVPLVLAGCGPRSGGGRLPRAVTPASSSDLTAQYLWERADEHWKRREDPEFIRRAIVSLESLVALDPGDARAWGRLSHAYYLLADLEPRESRKSKLHEAGADVGGRGVRVAAGALPDDDLDEAALLAPPGSEEALYWTAANLARYAQVEGVASNLLLAPTVRALAGRILQLDETWDYAAVHRLLGAVDAIAPPVAGGNLQTSREHFVRALAIAPDQLWTRVLFAECYATRANDRALFEAQLRFVLEARPALPDREPEQWAARRRARQLLDHADALF